MNWKALLGLFAKPLGAAINNAISAAAGAAITYAATKGIGADITTPIVGAVAFAISSAISAAAATQGVQIPIINNDQTNGVRVVSAAKADEKGLPPVDAPKP